MPTTSQPPKVQLEQKRIGILVTGCTLGQLVTWLHASGQQAAVLSARRTGSSSATNRDTVTPDDLSERELEILTLIAAGLSNAEISREAFLSVNTVKSYIRSCYRKIDAHTRSQAVIWAINNGLGERPTSA